MTTLRQSILDLLGVCYSATATQLQRDLERSYSAYDVATELGKMEKDGLLERIPHNNGHGDEYKITPQSQRPKQGKASNNGNNG